MYSKRYEEISVKNYDKMYENTQSDAENREIKLALSYFIEKGDKVLDLGCGTQLVKKLLRGVGVKYTGVDLENWGKKSIVISDGYKYLKDCEDYDVITSTFAIDYMNPFVLLRALRKSLYLIFTTYNRPYEKGSVSLYTNRKWYYVRNHFFRKLVRNLILFLLRDRIVVKMKLTGNNYYNLYVVEGYRLDNFNK